MTDVTAKRERFCCYCGAGLGFLAARDWEPTDTCGARECERYAREQARAERDEAHRRLDEDLGW